MTSVVQIAKMALSHLGKNWDISALTEASEEARQCNLHYEPARDAALRDVAPGWATCYATASGLTGTVPGGWEYMYAYPTTSLRLLEIVNSLGSNSPTIPFEVAISVDGTRIILTDQEDAELKFVTRVNDPNAFDPLFVKALAFRLAADVAIPLTGNAQVATTMEQQYRLAINVAAMGTANEGYVDRQQASTFITARA